MPIETRLVKGNEYLYFTYYEPISRSKKRLYCGPASDPRSLEKAKVFEREHLREKDKWEKQKRERARHETEWVESSFRELIDELLMKNGPMHYRKLTEEILKVRSTKGKTPDQTILAILERGCRGKEARYVHNAQGVYGLREGQFNTTLKVKEIPARGKVELGLNLTNQLEGLGVGGGDLVRVKVDDGKIIISKEAAKTMSEKEAEK